MQFSRYLTFWRKRNKKLHFQPRKWCWKKKLHFQPKHDVENNSLFSSSFLYISSSGIPFVSVTFILREIEKFLIFLFVLCFPITKMIVARSAEPFSWLVAGTISPFQAIFLSSWTHQKKHTNITRRNIQKHNHTLKGIWKDTFETNQMVF